MWRSRYRIVYDVPMNQDYDEWTFPTDPANLQPRVRPLFRNVAQHLSRYPPRGVEQSELDRVIEAVEAPWGMRTDTQTPPDQSAVAPRVVG